MKKHFRKPFIVRNFYNFSGLFPIPGIEFNCYVNKRLTIIRVSEQFSRIAHGDPAYFALRKLKQLLTEYADKAKSGEPINIFTDMLPEIDFWPTVTEGELHLWKAQKELAVYRSPNDLKYAIVNELYKIQRTEPDYMISLDGLAARMSTPYDLLKTAVPSLEEEGYLSRKGEKYEVHKTDWVLITEKGINFLDEAAQVKVADTPEEIADRLLGEKA